MKKVVYLGERNGYVGKEYQQNKFRNFHERELIEKYIGAVCIVRRKK